MTQIYRYLSLFILPLIMVLSLSTTSHGQCPVVPSFSYSTTCQLDYEISFTNSSTAPGGWISAYYWDFGDGTNSVLIDPTHVFPGPGIYSVYLYVYDTSGCYDSILQNVTASQLPVASYTTSIVGCRMLNFSNSSVYNGGVPSWSWNFDDPASGVNNTSVVLHPVHVFTSPGTYNVMLAMTDNFGCTDTIYQMVTVDPVIPDFAWDSTCANSLIQFTDLSTSPVDPITFWQWTFGDGGVSNLQDPSHTYSNGGIYTVSLTITTASGCLENVTHTLSINYPPDPDFSASLTCWGDSTVFTDLTTLPTPGQIASWFWDFGDGNTSTLQNPVHTYSIAGIYSVTLIVTDTNDCNSMVTNPVEVFIPPIANFNASTECDGFPTSFLDISIANPIPLVSWMWNFGDGLSSTAQHPTHLYPGPGAYFVTLIVTNLEGCESTFSDSVYVLENPIAAFEADTVCVGEATNFTDLSQPLGQIISWSWDFGDPPSGANNSSFLQNPLHTYTTSGEFTVTLTITDVNGCMNTISQDVRVESLPIANFTFLNEACMGEEVLFTDISVPGNEPIIMWAWDYDDGTYDTIYAPANPSVIHVFNNPGIYFVTLSVVTERGCMGTVSKQMNIMSSPNADYTYTWSCEDMQTQFNDLSSLNGGSPVINWWWDFGDPLSGGANNSFFQHPQHEFSAPGFYFVSLIVWNVEFCSDTIVKIVEVLEKPPVDYFYDAACENQYTRFFTDSTVVNLSTITSYLWDFDDGDFSNLQNPWHLFPGAGTYNVTLTITDTSLCESSETKPVIVDPPPVSFFDVSEPTCEDDSVWFDDLSSTTFGYIDMWVWDFDDGTPPDTIIFPDDPNVYHIYANIGVYGPTLEVFNSQGCSHTYTRIIEIDGKPIANFHWSANACQYEEVQFTDASFPNGFGNIITWEWEFDDPLSGANNTSVQENPIHIFTDGGIFNVRLVVTNFNDCRDTIIKTINVNYAPEVAFTYANPCEDTLTYFFPDTTIMDPLTVVSWYWDFGDGQNSTSENPAHQYEVPGYYNVTLLIQDTGVCTASITSEIFIFSTPEVLFDVSEITCMNSPVFFEDLSSVTDSYIVEWYWEFGDGTDTTIYFPDSPNVDHTYTLDGTYLVTLSVISNDTCYATGNQFVVIDKAPIALFTYDAACDEIPVQFWDNSSMGGGLTIIEWLWDFGDPNSNPNNTSTLQNPVHEFTAPGTYNVTLSVLNVDGCTDDVVGQVLVNVGAPVDFYSIDTCHNFNTLFFVDTAYTDTAAIILYDWDFGDGSLHSNLMNPEHLYVDPGAYDVILTIYDTSGCSNSETHQVLVRDNPVALFEYEVACTNDSTYFTDLSYTVNGDQIVAWEWDFGDPFSGANNYSTLQNPAHLFTNNVLFEVKLVVTTDYGCRDSVEFPVTVYSGPTAEFNYNVESCESGLVYFQDVSITTQAPILQWEWYFESGSYSYIPNPNHSFQKVDTTYIVSLTVTDANGCESYIEHEVFIPAGFEIEMNHTQACVGEPMGFDISILSPVGDSIFSYYWNFGDPASGPYNFSTLPEPTHVYNSAGYYTVTVNVVDIFGCPKQLFDQVYVDDLPEPGFTYHPGDCDSILYFSDLSFGNGANIISWEWDFGDGSPPEIVITPPGNTSHFYTTEGIYDVTLTVINALGCENTIIQEVEMTPCVSSEFYVLNSPVCERNNIYFADSSGIESMLDRWYWDFGDGTDTVYFHKSEVIHHFYANAGEYEVMLVVSAQSGPQLVSDTVISEVTIHPTPEPDYFAASVCDGEATYFYDSTAHSGFFIDSWLWDFGTGDPGDISDLKNPVFEYETPGAYDVILTVTNQFGCIDSITKETEVFYLPTADFKYSLACEGDPILFTDLSDGFDEEVVAWRWFFNDPFKSGDTSHLQDPEWIYAENGTYTPSLIITNANGCVDTTENDIEVNTVPTAAFDLYGESDEMQGMILLEDHSEAAVEYHWTFGDGYEMWGNTPPIEHIYEEDGSYDIQLVIWNEYGCTDTADANFEFMFKTLFIPSALSPTSRDPLVQIFKPVGRNIRNYYIAIHDTWGNIIWESTKLDRNGSPVDSWDGTLKGELLPTGVYIWWATATFKDGTIWEGTSVGDNSGSSFNTSGTVTLVR